MLLDRVFPPDIRVEKEARGLIKAGHEVLLLSLSSKNRLEIEYVEGVNVHRFDPGNKYVASLFYSLSYKDPTWEKKLTELVRNESVEVIHVHDLPLVKMAKSVAIKCGVPIVVDLHENFPEAVRYYKDQKRPLLKRIYDSTMPVSRWKRFEISCLRDVSHVITVVEEAKEHYVNDCNVPANKVTVVMNTEDLEEFDSLIIDEQLVDKYRQEFVISYIGGFGMHRGIDTAIKSMPLILKDIPNARLLLVGKGEQECESKLRLLCKDLEVESNVTFTGWVDFRLVPTYIQLSDICLVPHRASGHTNTTIPHKLFQYMAMKKPIIVTDCPPLRRIIEETGSGVTVPSGSFTKIAEEVISLYKDPETSKSIGESGRKAVDEVYNWKTESAKLCAVYGSISNENHSRVR